MTFFDKEHIPRYLNEQGKIAALYSPGYGAGWSSWNSEYAETLLFHEDLVEAAINSVSYKEVERILDHILGPDHHTYLGGWKQVAIEWVEKGELIRVTEYDGYETLEVIGKLQGFIA